MLLQAVVLEGQVVASMGQPPWKVVRGWRTGASFARMKLEDARAVVAERRRVVRREGCCMLADGGVLEYGWL